MPFCVFGLEAGIESSFRVGLCMIYFLLLIAIPINLTEWVLHFILTSFKAAIT